MKKLQRILSLALCCVIAVSMVAAPSVAHASDFTDLIAASAKDWLAGWTGQNTGVWNPVDPLMGFFTVSSSGNSVPAAANTPPKNYYTTLTNSVEDKYGNVTNYYRGGDTTNTQIIDSYNKTFNTIHNTTNTTNNYKANVRLSDFLNTYTTNNVTNKYTYSADFKSWYYDNTTNNYTYNEFNKYDTTNNYLYYNQDNSRYYISIDNSTDEYYLVDVQYSPTFVTVNYTYNTTNNRYDSDVGDVTNVYYYELKDGRNSSTLTAAEVAGIDFGYDVGNYELVTDDPNTLSLQHFDGDYTDSSSYNRTFYSQNRSTNYVDSGAFGKAVSLPNGSAAGVTIPGLSSYSSLSFDFRIYYNDISNLGIYFGDTNIFHEFPMLRRWAGRDVYSDNNTAMQSYIQTRPTLSSVVYTNVLLEKRYYPDAEFRQYINTRSCTVPALSNTFQSQMTVPVSYNSAGYVEESTSTKYGWADVSSAPTLYSTSGYAGYNVTYTYNAQTSVTPATAEGKIWHYTDKEYRWSPSRYVAADFSYDSYKNQWVSMRITIFGGNLYYFVNGDLVGSGPFTKPTADKFYIKSSGTIYLDELRVTTGSLSSTGTYNPANAPYDTNKVLALPDNLTANTIYVQHNTTVTSCRIGGVRPSNPTIGFLYIPLYDDRTAAQPQLYDGGNWVDVTAMVYTGSTAVNVLGYKFTPVGDSPDIDMDAKPEHPVQPGDDPDPETCIHDWEVTGGVEPTCTLLGSIEYTCSKCGATKTESLPKLTHIWEVKQTVQTSYDENGEILTQGFTIYRCSLCGEEYKDTTGSGPPASSTVIPSNPDDSDNDSWLSKLGEFLGSVLGGLIDLIGSVLGGILDGLINLVTSAFDKLTRLVDLFGSFGEALGILWTWLPSEIMLVLVAGVTVFVFIALLKLFLK